MTKYINSEKLKELIDEKWKELANRELKVGGHQWDPEINTYLSVLKLVDSLQQDQSNNNLEEKAEAYDAALKRAKAAIDIAADKDLVKGVAITILPELCESEDEKIRKELLAVINDLVLPNEQKARFNAWLEKQKEEKPIEWSKEDEKNISAIKIALRDAKLEAPEEFESNGVEMTVKDFENAELWFKSIHSSWKPSEQEKLALETAICILTEMNCPKTVANLQVILDAFDDKESHPF